MSSLLEMPKVAMKLITDELDLKTIVILRKVCRDIRHYIDDVQPDSTVKYIRIEVTNEKIRVHLGHFYGLFYTRRQDDGCELEFVERKIECGPLISKRLVLNDQDFIDASLQDLKIIFQHQNSVIENLSLCMRFNRGVLCEDFVARPFLEGLKKLLIFRSNPLKVQYFYINERKQNDVMSVLPYLHVGSLETIEVFGDDMFEKKDMIYLEQWNGAKSISVDRWIDDIPAQYFTHLHSGCVNFLTISTNDLIVLKEAFLQNLDFQRFTLNYKNIQNEEGLDSFIGPLYEKEHGYNEEYGIRFLSPERRKRCFKMENHNLFLKIEQTTKLKQIIFVRSSNLAKSKNLERKNT